MAAAAEWAGRRVTLTEDVEVVQTGMWRVAVAAVEQADRREMWKLAVAAGQVGQRGRLRVGESCLRRARLSMGAKGQYKIDVDMPQKYSGD